MVDNIKSRLLEFISAIESNSRKFSISIGKSDSYIRTIKNTIGADVITDISRIYPQLNIKWLLTGEGKMLKPNLECDEHEKNLESLSDPLPEYMIKKRLLLFLNYLNIGQTKFEKECGFSRGFVNKLTDGIGINKVLILYKKYPEINLEWLITGEGEMIRSKTKETFHSQDKDYINIINSLTDSNKSLAKANKELSESLNKILSNSLK